MTKYIAKTPDVDGFIDFSPEENATWQMLYERQFDIVKTRGCPEYLDGLARLDLPHDYIPQCADVSLVLQNTTGFSVVPVNTLIPLEKFFELLANRHFPAASFIRTREELDYLQEPDIFHEFFGHCPLLTNPDYADFVQWYGEKALTASKHAQALLGRLFWFTIEFGLIRTAKGLRVYGGGILSSFAETVFALESNEPERYDFDIEKILHMPYRYDQIQKCYFVIEQLSDLFALKDNKILLLVENIIDDNNETNFITC